MSQGAPELRYWYTDAIRVFEVREAAFNRTAKKMARKRINNPTCYRCAAPGCPIVADAGRMLSRCSGTCAEMLKEMKRIGEEKHGGLPKTGSVGEHLEVFRV
ncbi:hypothetical protein BKA70DRAFT_512190 [Coprinopsis sp. MPI-PUGE-AT-0042]|nr:hypothetical protein BKA70DRAFT_512190 [Coprinopsis sp. MPI-PUGE-AT-0042]